MNIKMALIYEYCCKDIGQNRQLKQIIAIFENSTILFQPLFKREDS